MLANTSPTRPHLPLAPALAIPTAALPSEVVLILRPCPTKSIRRSRDRLGSSSSASKPMAVYLMKVGTLNWSWSLQRLQPKAVPERL